MIQANLIPIPRRLARLGQRRVRLWITICSAYCVLLVAAYASLQVFLGNGDKVLERDVTTISKEIIGIEQEVNVVTPKLEEARLTLAASLAVGSQPDWSLLLAVLAAELRGEDEPAQKQLEQALVGAGAVPGGPPDLARLFAAPSRDVTRHIVLLACDLAPIVEAAPLAGAGAGKDLPATQPRHTLALSGMGKSQAAISKYVLRLEQTGLFNRVTLLESRRVPFAGGQAISFRIGCIMGGEKE